MYLTILILRRSKIHGWPKRDLRVHQGNVWGGGTTDSPSPAISALCSCSKYNQNLMILWKAKQIYLLQHKLLWTWACFGRCTVLKSVSRVAMCVTYLTPVLSPSVCICERFYKESKRPLDIKGICHFLEPKCVQNKTSDCSYWQEATMELRVQFKPKLNIMWVNGKCCS